ncbi:MAG: hypothetical protein MUC34_12945 [Anaerolineae bacterium]|jgi:hypothetical protein|nr:hypothetical protein [Anaerolineae bacterium]
MSEATVTEKRAAPRPRWAKIVMIVMTILWLIALLPAAGFALMFPFAFDQGPSQQATIVALGLVGGPFAIIGALLLAWLLFAARLVKLAVIAMFLPLVYFVIFLLVSGWAGSDIPRQSAL